MKLRLAPWIAFCFAGTVCLDGGRAHADVATVDLKVMSFNVLGGAGLDAIFGPDSWWNITEIGRAHV